MICSICGKEFTPVASRRKYCSKDCSDWAERNRCRRRDYLKKLRKQEFEPIRKDPELSGCGGLSEHLRRLVSTGRIYE